MQRTLRSRRHRERRLDSLALGRGHAAVLLSLSLAGMGSSLYLTYVHYRLHLEPGWQSICAISATVNCDAVVLSPYGSLAGTPLSAFGVWFYALTGLVALAGVRGNGRQFPRSPAVVLFVAGAFATALSAVLALLSVLSIGSLCLLCATLYAVSIAMLLTAWGALRRTGEHVRQALTAERRYWMRHLGKAAATVTGALAVLTAIVGYYARGSGPFSSACEAVAASSATIPPTPVMLLVYADFQCPHCRTLDRTLRSLRGQSGVQIVTRHYPLDRSCNPAMKQPGHRGACLQARAALCSGAQGRYDEFSDRLFDEGAADRAGLTALAGSLALDRARFESCLDSEDSGKALDESIKAAIADGVIGTPTLFVNGRRHAPQLSSADLACLARGTPEGGEGVSRRTNQ